MATLQNMMQVVHMKLLLLEYCQLWMAQNLTTLDSEVWLYTSKSDDTWSWRTLGYMS
jgi:hypothetical protein